MKQNGLDTTLEDCPKMEIRQMLSSGEVGDDKETFGKASAADAGVIPIDKGWAWMILLGMFFFQRLLAHNWAVLHIINFKWYHCTKLA